MSYPQNDSLLIRCIRWFENNFLEFFKTVEGIVLFIVSIVLTPSTYSLIKIIQNSDIPLTTVFVNKSFYALLTLVVLYPFLLWKFVRRRKEETTNLENLTKENEELKKSEKEISNNLSQVDQNLNEAQEAIGELKTQHLNEAREITSKFLAFLFKQLNFSSNDRICLYMLIKVDDDETNKDFLHIFGRFSVNVDFKRINRVRFPKDEGVIGQAFTSDKTNTEVVHLSQNDEEYLEETKKLGINKSIAKSFSMKSKSFYPYMITKRLDDRIGVLLCESVTVDKNFDIEEINKLFKQHDSILIELLDYNHSILSKTNVNKDKI